ncbi:MAG: dihydrofolate reductase [Clostridiales bacterium]|nr:dihydrofolate reductase [Clostridiales bacterium]
MNAIVVVDEQWGIGKNNGLLFRLKKDMAFFRKTTTGKVIVVGAKTYASFPSGALPDRTNIVLDDSGAKYPDAISVSSVAELDRLLASYPSDDVFVCGGASVYSLLIDRCKYAYVTKVKADGNAQVFFPNLDKLPGWSLVEVSETVQDGEYNIKFCKYVNNLQ